MNKKIKHQWLDIACGMGSSLQAYNHDDSIQTTGIDINPFVVEQMKIKHPADTFITADAQRMPFPPLTFSKIFCAHALEHIDSPDSVLQECQRILIKKGVMIISSPHPHYEKIVSHSYPHYHSKQFHQHVFTKKDLTLMAERAKFSLKKIQQRRWFYAVFLTFWIYLGKVLGKPLEHHGMMCVQNNGKELTTIKRVIQFFSASPRTIADWLDKIPGINMLNKLYPFEFLVILEK